MFNIRDSVSHYEFLIPGRVLDWLYHGDSLYCIVFHFHATIQIFNVKYLKKDIACSDGQLTNFY